MALYSQKRVNIDGFVTDAKTGESMPYTNIHFKQNSNGTITQNDGRFSIATAHIPDTLIVSSIGYISAEIIISEIKNYSLNIALEPAEIELHEVVIVPGENPANIVMRKVIAQKDRNNPMKAATMACNTYTKILVHTANNKTSRSEYNVPVYFSEKYSHNIVQQNPYFEKGKIISERQEGLGFLNEFSIMGYANNLGLGYNFYENIIEILDKPFISPLNNRAFSYYRYYLKDSTMSMFGKEYLLEFKPRNERDMAFTGHMKIIDDVWAISEIFLTIPPYANLNYVNSMKIFQSFQAVNDSMTFFHINETEAELKITKDNALLEIDFKALINKRSVYDNVIMNFAKVKPGDEEHIWELISPVPRTLKPSAISISTLRPEELTIKELRAIMSIDSLNNNWKIRIADAASRMFITGYIPGNYIDVGPYLELVKNNRVEGYRYTLSGRTSESLTRNTMIFSHLGYGTRDQEWKYGLGATRKLSNEYRRMATVEYRNDLSRIGDNGSIFLIKENMMTTGEDNIIASIFTNSLVEKISREISYRVHYEHEWRWGLTTHTGLTRKTIYSGEFLPFTTNQTPVEKFTTNELILGLRLSWRENYSDVYCRRYYMTTQYPIINIRLTGGIYSMDNNSNEYLTARAVINHDVNIGQTKLEYVAEAGLTLGSVPFPLLEISRSDQSLGYALFSFNMMNEMEFTADRFISFMPQYHLNGLLFNRLPLLKQMGVREVFSLKMLWSHLNSSHGNLLDYPVNFFDARTPYTEVSAGIENLFQYFRIEMVWRLTHLNHPNARMFGIMARFDVNF
jgi:hypothetical protein